MSESDSEKSARENAEDWSPLLHLHAARECIVELERENERLREALQGLYGLVKSGALVRDASKDHERDWAMRQLPFVAKLKAAQAALKERGDDT